MEEQEHMYAVGHRLSNGPWIVSAPWAGGAPDAAQAMTRRAIDAGSEAVAIYEDGKMIEFEDMRPRWMAEADRTAERTRLNPRRRA